MASSDEHQEVQGIGGIDLVAELFKQDARLYYWCLFSPQKTRPSQQLNRVDSNPIQVVQYTKIPGASGLRLESAKAVPHFFRNEHWPR